MKNSTTVRSRYGFIRVDDLLYRVRCKVDKAKTRATLAYFKVVKRSGECSGTLPLICLADTRLIKVCIVVVSWATLRGALFEARVTAARPIGVEGDLAVTHMLVRRLEVANARLLEVVVRVLGGSGRFLGHSRRRAVLVAAGHECTFAVGYLLVVRLSAHTTP